MAIASIVALTTPSDIQARTPGTVVRFNDSQTAELASKFEFETKVDGVIIGARAMDDQYQKCIANHVRFMLRVGRGEDQGQKTPLKFSPDQVYDEFLRRLQDSLGQDTEVHIESFSIATGYLKKKPFNRTDNNAMNRSRPR